MDDQTRTGTVDDPAYYYDIRLLIFHPSMKAGDITTALGLQPDYSWNAGEGRHTETMWGHVSRTSGKRHFFGEVGDVLEWLGGRKELLTQLLTSGGRAQVIVQLPGSINIGDTLRSEALTRASELGVEIGIEVFPKLSAS